MLWLFSWYLIPLCRWALRCGGRYAVARRWARVLGVLGRIEWAVHLVRDTVGLAYFGWIGVMAARDLLNAWEAGAAAAPMFGWSGSFLSISAIVVGLSSAVWWDERRRRVRLLALATQTPHIHPADFFAWYFADHGPVPLALPQAPQRLDGDVCDARGGVVRTSVWPLLHALASTYFMSSLVLLAVRRRGVPSRATVSGLMAIWGARVLQLCRAAVRIEGAAHLAQVRGPIVCCANHVSAIDVVALPVALALAAAHLPRPVHVRFLAARDHFLDNWFIRRVLRLGDAMDAAEMVFVHRRGTPAQRAQSVADAVERMTARGIDVIVFPQGTRAPARPRDVLAVPAGYYTAGGPTRAATPGAHLKPGAARMALAAAQAAGGATLLPIGIIGTDRVVPSRAFFARTQQHIVVRFGIPLVIDAATLPDAAALTQQLDAGLRATLQGDTALLAWAAAHGYGIAEQILAQHPLRRLLLATLDVIPQLPREERAAQLARWHALAGNPLAMPDDAQVFHQAVVAAWASANTSD